MYKEGQPWGYKLTNVVNNKFYYGIAGAEQTPDTYTTSSKNTELLSAISKGQVVRDIVLTDSSYENMKAWENDILKKNNAENNTLSYNKSNGILGKVKEVVNDKVKEGLSKKEIYNFLSDKYGDWILFNTPLKANSYFLWFMPYVLFILGGIFLYLVIRKSTEKTKQ